MPDAQNKKTFEIVVDLIKAISWPLLLVILVLCYRDSIGRIADELPELFSHAREVKVGSVSFTVEQEAQYSNPKLAEALKGLSPEARKILLQTSLNTTHILWSKTTHDSKVSYYDAWADRDGALKELAKRNLIQFKEDPNSFAKFIKDIGLQKAGNESNEYTATRAISSDEEQRLLAQGFFLSDLGKQAYNLIIDVVVRS